jgi:protein-disulfide isomerase/uncharacterized membrane protein
MNSTSLNNSPHTQQFKNHSILIILTSFVGWIVSAYSVWHREVLLTSGTKEGSFCSINSKIDCDVVALSKYAELFGFSTAGWALIFYGVFFISAISLYFNLVDNATDRILFKNRLLFYFSGISLVPTSFLAFQSAFALKTLCLLCLALYVCNIVIFYFSLKNYQLTKPQSEPLVVNQAFLIMGAVVALLNTGLFFVFQYSARGTGLSKDVVDSAIYSHTIQKNRVFNTENAPSTGPKDAKVTLVEFSDFQCPFCAVSARTLPVAIKKFEGQVRVVFKNYPLDSACNKNLEAGMHPLACFTAKAGWCFFKEKGDEAFFDFKKHLFANQDSIKTQDFVLNAAMERGMDKAKLIECIQDPATHETIVGQIEEGKAADIRGTPALFVNGKNVPTGPLPFMLQKIIDLYL